MRYLLNLFFIICISSTFSLHAESDADKTLRFLPEMQYPLAVKLALPDSFVVGAFPQGSPPTVGTGVFWAAPSTIKELSEQSEKNIRLTQGAFRVRLTTNVTQTESNQFSFGDDASLRADLETTGALNVEIKRLFWGPYPVVSATFTIRGKGPQALAWVGLNHEGYTLFISYIFPTQTVPASDYTIWNTFINNTTALSPNEYLKVHGYDIKLGVTTFSRAHAKVRYTSEKLLEGKTVIMVEILTRDTQHTVLEVIRRTVKDSKAARVDLVIDMDSSVDGILASGEEMIPLFPKLVDKISLKGATVFEDTNDDITIIMHSSR